MFTQFSIFVVFCSTCLCCVLGTRPRFSCKDQNNNDVDWYAVYKLYKDSDHPVTSISEGYGFFYMDVHKKSWTLSNVGLDKNTHSIANTLNQYYSYQNDSDIFIMMYNDEFPNGHVSYSKGHTKGTIFFDGTSGIWLIHSVPKFPPTDQYEYAQNGRRYSQSMMCITFKYDQLKKIAQQLYIDEPAIYLNKIPANVSREIPILGSVGNSVNSPPYTRRAELVTDGGQPLTHFAKAGGYNNDIYWSFIAPSLKASLDMEGWRNGAGNLPTNCSSLYKVYNILKIRLPNSVGFTTSHDHSKFAVAVPWSPKWVCVGDMNRQHGQLDRGGGSMCIKDADVWWTYHHSIAQWESCPSRLKIWLNQIYAILNHD